MRDIKKSFYLPNHKNDSLKSSITQVFKPKDKGINTFHALDGISFNVEKGDFFGILGRNGSGKSTLLKIIAEIYRPTSGNVSHSGKIVSFIELGVGFKSELSGRENVFLNGAMLGFSKKEMEAMYDEIVEFAELEKFMDQKLKNYSSGMKVRLAFSVAIRAKADILILDEVLAVGDADFQRKCNDYFETLKDDNKTVILVTHSMGNVRKYCNKAVVIENGEVIYNGNSEGAVDKYNNLFSKKKLPAVNSYDDDAITDSKISSTHSEKSIDISISTTVKRDIEDVVLAVLIYKKSTNVYRWVSDEEVNENINLISKKTNKQSIRIQNIFPPGDYSVTLMIRSRDRTVDYGLFESAVNFENKINSKYPHRKLWNPEAGFKHEQ